MLGNLSFVERTAVRKQVTYHNISSCFLPLGLTETPRHSFPLLDFLSQHLFVQFGLLAVPIAKTKNRATSVNTTIMKKCVIMST